MFADDFEGRVLPFDSEAPPPYAEIFAARQRAGRPVASLDLMIAAIGYARGASIVTHNVGDFAGFGIPVINLWQTP
jgi:predicted nucleic acid-binding protein